MNGAPPNNAPSNLAGTAIPRRLPEQSTIPKESIFHIIMTQKGMKPDGHYSPEQALHRPVPKRDESALGIDTLTRQALPYFLPWKPTAGPGEVPPSFDWLTNSCGGKAAIGE